MTDVPTNLLQAAKDWQAAQIKVTTTTLGVTTTDSKGKLGPQWKAAKLEKLAGGKSLIVVESPAIKLSSTSKQGVVRKFVFSTDGSNITGGKIIEMYGSADYMASHNSNLLENLTVLDDGDCWDVYLEFYYINSYGNVVVYADYYLYSYCDDDNNELGGGDPGGGAPSNSTQQGDGNYGDHHLLFTKIPPITTTDVQKPNLCVFKAMEWVSLNFGTTILYTTFEDSYTKSLSATTHTAFTNDYVENVGVAEQYLLSFIDLYYYNTPTTNVTGAIDAGNPVMATLFNGVEGHEVEITGYNNDGTYEYFDPQLGCYNHQAPSQFGDITSITGVNPNPPQ